MMGKLKYYVEKFPFAAYMYRTIRDRWVFERQWPKANPLGFSLIGRQDMQNGSFELQETKVIVRHLPDTEVFIDVGANIGYYTCIARVLRKYTVSIEPLLENLLYLYTNLKRNGWDDSEVWPIGLGSQPGLKTLYGGSTGASLIKTWAESAESFSRLIPISTLDIVLGERFAGKNLMIKVDVEGAEYEVLKGAVKTLGRIPSPIWVIEICLTENFPTGINAHFEETFRIFWDNGYEARSLGMDSRIVTPDMVARWVRFREHESGCTNYIFKKNTPKIP